MAAEDPGASRPQTRLTRGRLWFDEHGHLNRSGPVGLPEHLHALANQLRLFLARLDSCERTVTGGYLLRDARAGSLGGMRVLWENVVLLAQAGIAQTLPRMSPDQHAAMRRDGVFATTTGPMRNARPLADALRQLLFLIPRDAGGRWATEVPSATVEMIRAIANETSIHRAMLERSSVDAARTATADPRRRQRTAATTRERSRADHVRELLTGDLPFEGSKTDLAREVGYLHPSALEHVKNFGNLWGENQRKLAEVRARRERSMLRSDNR